MSVTNSEASAAMNLCSSSPPSNVASPSHSSVANLDDTDIGRYDIDLSHAEMIDT